MFRKNKIVNKNNHFYPNGVFLQAQTMGYTFLNAIYISSGCLAPVSTIFPETNIIRTTLGVFYLKIRPGNI